MNLFIIGNGFDLAYGYKTSYTDFLDFLKREAEVQEIGYSGYVPERQGLADGSVIYDGKEVAKYLLEIIEVSPPGGNNWADFEEMLGRWDYSDYLVSSKDGLDYKEQAHSNEVTTSDLLGATTKIKNFITAWSKELGTRSKPFFSINKIKLSPSIGDLVLNFNYTDIFEKVYNIKIDNICYIHGKDGKNIVFGHGNNKDYNENNQDAYIGANTYEIYDALKKDIDIALDNNIDFFNRIGSEVNEVHSYGFSYSDADLIYIKEICNRLTNPSLVWHLHGLTYDDNEAAANKIIECGYKGEFALYSKDKKILSDDIVF